MLWLCSKQVAAVLIRPLAWELPYAADAALKKKKRKKAKTKITELLPVYKGCGAIGLA